MHSTVTLASFGWFGQTIASLRTQAREVTGLFVAPSAGNFSFWVQGAGNSTVMASIDATADEPAVVASSTGMTMDYDMQPTQKSAPIYLDRGEVSYVAHPLFLWWAARWFPTNLVPLGEVFFFPFVCLFVLLAGFQPTWFHWGRSSFFSVCLFVRFVVLF
jgi:hypothetical protein